MKLARSRREGMELNLSFKQLLDLVSHAGNPIAKTIQPVILLAVFAEILRDLPARRPLPPGGDTAVSAGVAIGHLITQAAVQGLIVGVIAATVYHYRLFTIERRFG